jgi:hypothetical protein
MRLEDQVCSLDLAKRLKELRVKQESLFYWRQGYSTSHLDIGKPTERHEFNVRRYELTYNPKPRYEAAVVLPFPLERAKVYDAECSAFTVAELGEMLPAKHIPKKYEVASGVGHRWGNSHPRNGDSSIKEADQRAKMLVYLLENKLITL